MRCKVKAARQDTGGSGKRRRALLPTKCVGGAPHGILGSHLTARRRVPVSSDASEKLGSESRLPLAVPGAEGRAEVPLLGLPRGFCRSRPRQAR